MIKDDSFIKLNRLRKVRDDSCFSRSDFLQKARFTGVSIVY